MSGDNDDSKTMDCAWNWRLVSSCGSMVLVLIDEQQLGWPSDEHATNKSHALERKSN